MPPTINYRGVIVDRADMEAAFELFDAYERSDFPWWRRWVIEFKGNHYPPKQCMRIASGIQQVHGGGPPINQWFEALGFNVVDTFKLESDRRAFRNDVVQYFDTEKETLLKTRIGQGVFRSRLLQRWGNQCSVTGCTITRLLRASHIVPWAKASNKQRLDVNNGLLLIPNLDLCFDQGFISFNDDGQVLISDELSPASQELLGIHPRLILRKPDTALCSYMRQHRIMHNLP